MTNNNLTKASIGAKAYLVADTVYDNSKEANTNESSTSDGLRKNKFSPQELAVEASQNLTDVLTNLSSELQNYWETYSSSIPGPDELSVEVSFAFEGKVNAWVIAGKGSTGIKATFKWERTKNE